MNSMLFIETIIRSNDVGTGTRTEVNIESTQVRSSRIYSFNLKPKSMDLAKLGLTEEEKAKLLQDLLEDLDVLVYSDTTGYDYEAKLEEESGKYVIALGDERRFG